MSYTWPGNIRELRNAVERGVALANSDVIELVDLPKSLSAAGGESSPPASVAADALDSRGQSLQEAELEYLKSILTTNQGNVTRAAQQAGMTRQGLHKRLKNIGLDARNFRT
jgi:two-component system response regulator HydG